jgi:hypothetical protein
VSTTANPGGDEREREQRRERDFRQHDRYLGGGEDHRPGGLSGCCAPQRCDSHGEPELAIDDVAEVADAGRGIGAGGRRCRRPRARRHSMTRCAPAATRSVAPPRPPTPTTARRRPRSRTLPNGRQERTRARPLRAAFRPRSADRASEWLMLLDAALPSPRSVSTPAATACRRHPGLLRPDQTSNQAFERKQAARGRTAEFEPSDGVSRSATACSPQPRVPGAWPKPFACATPAITPSDGPSGPTGALRTMGTSLSASGRADWLIVRLMVQATCLSTCCFAVPPRGRSPHPHGRISRGQPHLVRYCPWARRDLDRGHEALPRGASRARLCVPRCATTRTATRRIGIPTSRRTPRQAPASRRTRRAGSRRLIPRHVPLSRSPRPGLSPSAAGGT